MTVYYDPQSPIFNALTQCNDTIFKLVLGRVEFWVYMTLHVVMISLMLYNDVEIESDAVLQAAQAMQYFMTFFLTFYNANCYARYESLYPACMELMDSLLLFVQEMTISLHHPELQRHRVLAMKYLLASVYLFFMGITGGSIQGKEWSEVVRKGLLTKPEAQMLRSYPGGRVQLVLTSWAMQVVTDALTQDCMWKPKSQRIAHIHNRLDVYVVTMIKAYQHISNTMAMPIPFPYYHLMNLILVLNLIMLALLFASLKSWLTLFPFGTALLVFMGLREVSTALSDPFGMDAVDFPIAQYLDYTFDHAVCLTESFSHPDAYLRTIQMINIAKPFTDKQLKRTCNTEILYTKDFRPATDNPFAWNKDKPLKSLDVEECTRGHLKRVISSLPWEVAHKNDADRWAQQKDDGESEPDEQSVTSVSTQTRINQELRQRLDELGKNLKEIKENQVEYYAPSDRASENGDDEAPLARPRRRRGEDQPAPGQRYSSHHMWERKPSEARSLSRGSSAASLRAFNSDQVRDVARSFEEARMRIRGALDATDDVPKPGKSRGNGASNGRGLSRSSSRDQPPSRGVRSPRSGSQDYGDQGSRRSGSQQGSREGSRAGSRQGSHSRLPTRV